MKNLDEDAQRCKII